MFGPQCPDCGWPVVICALNKRKSIALGEMPECKSGTQKWWRQGAATGEDESVSREEMDNIFDACTKRSK